jgi:hypothetical protein
VELDHHRITIRERTYVDVLDLALRVIREFAWPLATVFGLGVVPMMLFDGWLLSGYEEEGLDAGGPVQYGLLMILLIAFETPLATALTTLYLGRAMFSQRPRLREVLRDLLGALPQLVLYQILLRPLCFRWTYLNEVILLDRNPIRRKSPQGRTTYSRAKTVHRGEGGDLFGRSFLSLGLGSLLVVAIWLSFGSAHTMFTGRLEWPPSMHTVYLPLAIWIVVCYFAVVRFLGYLDLRIRREGWEVELAMRAERARLMRYWG